MKRIDELTVEVGRLHQSLEVQRAGTAPVPPPKRDVVGPPPFSGFTDMKPEPATKIEPPKVEPKPEPAPSAVPVPAAAEPPKAEAVNGVRHVVAKGETLTSIAKHYNIPLAELLKANKDVNDRKLQIGQTISVPVKNPPEATSNETPTNDKKENP